MTMIAQSAAELIARVRAAHLATATSLTEDVHRVAESVASEHRGVRWPSQWRLSASSGRSPAAAGSLYWLCSWRRSAESGPHGTRGSCGRRAWITTSRCPLVAGMEPLFSHFPLMAAGFRYGLCRKSFKSGTGRWTTQQRKELLRSSKHGCHRLKSGGWGGVCCGCQGRLPTPRLQTATSEWPCMNLT